jgi:hypothetical protein
VSPIDKTITISVDQTQLLKQMDLIDREVMNTKPSDNCKKNRDNELFKKCIAPNIFKFI